MRFGAGALVPTGIGAGSALRGLAASADRVAYATRDTLFAVPR